MAAWKGDAAIARMWDDFVNKCFPAVFRAKDEESKAEAAKMLQEEHVKLMNDFGSKILGASKFICGDEVTVADFACAGFYVNVVENGNNPYKDMWAA